MPAKASDAPAASKEAEARLKQFARLREPFPPDQVGQLPRKNIKLDYVGHAAVTSRLLEVDPEWNWEPLAWDTEPAAGIGSRRIIEPLFDRDERGRPIGLWIKLTVCGTTRLGYGSCEPGQVDAKKVLIGDAIRNAAMRFGVALDLWIRGRDEEHLAGQREAERPSSTLPEQPAWLTELRKEHSPQEILNTINKIAEELGLESRRVRALPHIYNLPRDLQEQLAQRLTEHHERRQEPSDDAKPPKAEEGPEAAKKAAERVRQRALSDAALDSSP
jgi:hypothetical protein